MTGAQAARTKARRAARSRRRRRSADGLKRKTGAPPRNRVRPGSDARPSPTQGARGRHGTLALRPASTHEPRGSACAGAPDPAGAARSPRHRARCAACPGPPREVAATRKDPRTNRSQRPDCRRPRAHATLTPRPGRQWRLRLNAGSDTEPWLTPACSSGSCGHALTRRRNGLIVCASSRGWSR